VGNWDEVTTFLQERELDHVASASNYAEAIEWTQTLLHCKTAECV